VYVCICNAYRESHVCDAIKKSAGPATVTVEQVYARLGRDLRCGRCVNHVENLIKANSDRTAEAVRS
jgi:bacterioferritin-associated ferredoxin